MSSQLDPFREFFTKMNKDLAAWLQQEQETQLMLQDYNHTLTFLDEHFSNQKLFVELGPFCRVKAKRIDDKITIRMKKDLFVEMTREEAQPAVRALADLYREKVASCRTEINKIMTSMREMEHLISSYQDLI